VSDKQEPQEAGIATILQIFTAQKKSELKAISRAAIIDKTSFANFVLACMSGNTPWSHQISHRQFVPEGIQPNDQELAALGKAKVGKAEGDAKKAITKIGQIFVQRRMLVGHIFYTPDLSNWHFIYFDQRDIDRRQNHWGQGPHIHLINFLWPNQTAAGLWEQFNTGNVQLSNALHIRYLNN
jgi:hypothetical protein